MKKILPIAIVGILVFSGTISFPYSNVALNNVALNSGKNKERAENIVISFPSPVIEEKDNYISLHMEGATSYIINAGKPILPKIVRVVELPFGTRNIKVEVTPKGVKEYKIDKEIVPAPSPVCLSTGCKVDTPEKDELYWSNEIFPAKWYGYNIGCGLNSANKRVTFVTIHIFPIRYLPSSGKLYIANSAEIKISYEEPENEINEVSAYDLVIIAPSEFSADLQRLVEHKNNMGINTILKTTEEIYSEYDGRDKPEQIKYFIKDAIEKWNIKYVLLVGGMKSKIYAKPKDNANHGTSGWYLPVRYSNCRYYPGDDPGYICDLYYADIYKYEDGTPSFDDWDSNGNNVFAEWSQSKRDELDLYPDVHVGRLACRNREELNAVIDKIIDYERNCEPSWFKRIIGITGDGFIDQEDLNIEWDVNNLPDGEYTIYAQSTNDEGESGPIDIINITLDRSAKTSLSFNHDDHLKVSSYPAPPIAEIVSVSEGDVLGKDDYTYTPSEREAYCNRNSGWANIEYVDGILHIRGKSYDPKLYGDITNIKVWIKNSNGEIVFTAWRNGTKMYAEGDWTVGEKLLHGRGGAFYYMPEDFEKIFLSTSNGMFTGKKSVINALSQGSGFVFFSGHGSPDIWANHLPGIPGNRQNSELVGLSVSDIFSGPPFFPMNKISNKGKNFIVVVGGCHNSQINVSIIPTLLDWRNSRYMNTYGYPTPECWSWYIVKLPETGAIASIGNTGYGYGVLGEWCTVGGFDNWITTEFFRQYGEEKHDILGETYTQTINSYINHFKSLKIPEIEREGWEPADLKTVQQWILLGDPSLKIGGYS